MEQLPPLMRSGTSRAESRAKTWFRLSWGTLFKVKLYSEGGIKMGNINLTPEEIQVILSSIENCLKTCKEGGTGNACPDCAKLLGVKEKLQAM